ncbi:uncharacterized protein LOC134248346 [Saccostrea cucullata]|uniref:uncharacterized protein LOC134248346 n=1 Tax=Saccostrea cuccullata TaxID=36930 RepID=UPI002ED6BA61
MTSAACDVVYNYKMTRYQLLRFHKHVGDLSAESWRGVPKILTDREGSEPSILPVSPNCAKTDHRDHDWETIPTAANQRRRGLQEFLKKIKEEDLPVIDEKMEKISQQITQNKELCDSEIKRLQKYFDEIIAEMTNFKKLQEKKSELEKKRGIVDTMEFMEENNSTMSDYSLIDNHRELRKMLSELEVHMTSCEHSVRIARNSHSRHLVRHITVTGDVIHEYEYQEDGQTRLFTLPYRVTQNKDFNPTDVVCDSLCNILVTDPPNKQIHLLSPDGEFLKFLLTEREVNLPVSLSLYKSIYTVGGMQ